MIHHFMCLSAQVEIAVRIFSNDDLNGATAVWHYLEIMPNKYILKLVDYRHILHSESTGNSYTLIFKHMSALELKFALLS